MPKVPTLHWSKVVAAFEKAGWVHDRTRGKQGTLRKLIHYAGMTVEEFIDLL